MLWYKAWLETRWRFVCALVLSAGLCAVVVFTQPLIEELRIEAPGFGGRLDEMVREAMALVGTYPGYVWSQWFGKNLLNVWTFFAVFLGAGGVVAEQARGSALWTLSLPVSRRRLLGVRAAVGALELLALAVVPSLLVPVLSPLIGESYPLGAALSHALILYGGGLVIYAFTLLLSNLFGDQLKPIIIGLAVVFALGLVSLFSKDLSDYSVYTLMSGQKLYFEGTPPWAGLAASLAAAAALYFLALRTLERRDF
ncbi:MAG TPA: hypothetical protein VFX96_07495 [Pyrinomonadaceae bacterium]|nr:hypothetical protein [Pyrinomonadaceae bacterium]